MADKRQVVAWISKAEWEQVLEYLYSRDAKLQREALHQISAWKSRYGNSMPLAVECTADLIRCKILDLTGGMGEQELALLYGLALVRFVNIITEKKQKTISIPLRRLANELNIPEWVINLRHSATHGKMPKLNMCRKGWDFVMEWLRREYWSRQLGNSSKPQWVSEDEDSEEMLPPLSIKERKQKTIAENLRETLRSYTSEQFKAFQELQNDHKPNKSWNSTANLEWIIAQVKVLIQQSSCQAAAEILVEDGFLIPTAKQLVTLRIEQDDPDGKLHVPRTLLRFWQPLLKALHAYPFTQELIEEMFAELGRCKENNAEVRLHCLSSWISELLTAIQKADGKAMVPSQNQAAVKSKWKLFSHGVPLQWKQLMKKCLAFPCRTTPRLLKLIFSYMKPRLPLATQEQLLCLCSIYTQDDDDTDVSVNYSDQPIYTVESLQWKLKQDSKSKAHSHWDRAPPEDEEEDMSDHVEDEDMITETYEEEYIEMINMKAASERRDALEGSEWGVSSELIKWSEYPLGVVPGQTEDPSCLLIDSYSMMSVLEQQGSASRRNEQCVPMSATTGPPSDHCIWSQAELDHIKAGLRLF